MLTGTREYPPMRRQALISPKLAMPLTVFLVCPLHLCGDDRFKGELGCIFMFSDYYYYFLKKPFDIRFCHVDQFVLPCFAR